MAINDLKLSAGERIVKDYDFSVANVASGSDKEKIARHLVITNKRIIHRAEGDKSISQNEMPVTAADYIYSTFGVFSKNLFGPILMILIGLVLIILNAIKLGGSGIVYAVGAVVLVAGIIWLIILILSMKATVMIRISGKAPQNRILTIGTSEVTVVNARKKGKAKQKTEVLSIKVDKNVACAMVNEIGAIILDMKAEAANPKPKAVEAAPKAAASAPTPASPFEIPDKTNKE